MVKSIPALILTAVLLSGGGGPAAAADDEQVEQEYRLRGIGILILDPRDPPDLVKEKLRQFLDQVRPNVPDEYREEANRRQLEALLEADWRDGEALAQLDLVFHPGVTVEMIRDTVRATPVGTRSAEVCPAACPLRGHRPQAIHLHLTRGEEGAGDSIIAFRFFGGGNDGGDGGQDPGRDARVSQALELGRGFVDNYGQYGYDRAPVTKVFGVGVVVGAPRVPPEWMAPDEGP